MICWLRVLVWLFCTHSVIRKCCRLCKQLCHNWRLVFLCLLATAVLTWLIWTFHRPLFHATKFIWSPDYRHCVFRQRQYEIQEETSPLYVTVAYHGRIGNWMFMYASLLGIAQANGYIPSFPASHPLSSIFSLSKVQNKKIECLQTVYDDRPCSYNSQFMNLPPGNVTIDGYIQSWKYFRFVDEEVRKEFTLTSYVRTRALSDYKSYVGKYIQEGRHIIGIHVRRGDVLKPEARKLGFCNAPKSYLDNAMKYMLRRYPHAAFFVASDDIEWCRQNIVPPKLTDIFSSTESLQNMSKSLTIKTLHDKVPVVFSVALDSLSDFSMLTLCNHSIITVGTFGWWSAWMANGHVVYYKDFPLPGTKLDYEMIKEDFYPAHWVALSGCAGTVQPFVCWNSSFHLFIYFLFLALAILKNHF